MMRDYDSKKKFYDELQYFRMTSYKGKRIKERNQKFWFFFIFGPMMLIWLKNHVAGQKIFWKGWKNAKSNVSQARWKITLESFSFDTLVGV